MWVNLSQKDKEATEGQAGQTPSKIFFWNLVELAHMVVGDFRSPDLNYEGWLETVVESDQIKIIQPVNNKTFFTDLGKSKKEITVSGLVKGNLKGKVLVVIRTDRDYPQALGEVKSGKWSFSGCTLGGVDHQIYAVLIVRKDKPIIRSKIVNVRLERRT